jgi:hypothetical protein
MFRQVPDVTFWRMQNATPQTVEFDVVREDGRRAGSMVSWALPRAGGHLRVDEPDKQPIYEVIRSYFEPDNITVIVRAASTPGTPSPFHEQAPGAGGFS